MKFHLLILILFPIWLFSCSKPQNNLSIVPLEMLNSTDTLKEDTTLIYKATFYLVQNYSSDKNADKQIENFIHNNMDKDYAKYAQYDIIFYKESEFTNRKNILKSKRIIDRYSQDHDLIYQYLWYQGKFLTKNKFENGEIVNHKSTITVEDVLEK